MVANKSGAQSYGMTDEEVFGLAVHYYDEADIKVKSLNVETKVLKTNITYEPTEAEKEEVRREALKKLQEDAYREMQGKNKPKPATEQPVAEAQMSLFN
jgi:hypothetical protein